MLQQKIKEEKYKAKEMFYRANKEINMYKNKEKEKEEAEESYRVRVLFCLENI